MINYDISNDYVQAQASGKLYFFALLCIKFNNITIYYEILQIFWIVLFAIITQNVDISCHVLHANGILIIITSACLGLIVFIYGKATSKVERLIIGDQEIKCVVFFQFFLLVLMVIINGYMFFQALLVIIFGSHKAIMSNSCNHLLSSILFYMIITASLFLGIVIILYSVIKDKNIKYICMY